MPIAAKTAPPTRKRAAPRKAPAPVPPKTSPEGKAESGPSTGSRASPAEVQASVALLVKYVKRASGGGGAEIKRALGLRDAVWLYYAGKAITAGQIRKEGEKSKTRYWAV